MAGTDYATVTDYATRAVPLLPSRINRAMIAIVRVGVGLLAAKRGLENPARFRSR